MVGNHANSERGTKIGILSQELKLKVKVQFGLYCHQEIEFRRAHGCLRGNYVVWSFRISVIGDYFYPILSANSTGEEFLSEKNS